VCVLVRDEAAVHRPRVCVREDAQETTITRTSLLCGRTPASVNQCVCVCVCVDVSVCLCV
jgi:hypothetical protein